MVMMRTRPVALSFLLVCGVTRAETEPPIRVLIVDGFSNHDWARTTGLIRGVLEPTRLFRVDVATCPAKRTDSGFATFRPRLADYEVVLLNCNSLAHISHQLSATSTYLAPSQGLLLHGVLDPPAGGPSTPASPALCEALELAQPTHSRDEIW